MTASRQPDVQTYLDQQPRLNQRRRILHPALRAVGSLFCKVEVTGLENIPTQGATLLMMNHISIIDPAILTALVQDRYLIAMAKSESAENPLERFFINLWGNFFIRRGEVDRTALTSAIELLKAEHIVLIAPEGTRSPDGLQMPKSGTAYIAHKADAVVVPVALCGVQTWAQRLRSLRRAYARVHFGRGFRLVLPTGQRLSRPIREQMMREAMYQLAAAIPDEYAQQRGAFADLDNATTQYLRFVEPTSL